MLTHITPVETRSHLVALREEVDSLSQSNSRSLQQSILECTMLCEIDDDAVSSAYSTTSSTIAWNCAY